MSQQNSVSWLDVRPSGGKFVISRRRGFHSEERGSRFMFGATPIAVCCDMLAVGAVLRLCADPPAR